MKTRHAAGRNPQAGTGGTVEAAQHGARPIWSAVRRVNCGFHKGAMLLVVSGVGDFDGRSRADVLTAIRYEVTRVASKAADILLRQLR